MEFALGMVAGFLLWPWYCISLLVLLVIAEVIFCENDAYAAGFFTMLVGVSAIGWLGGSWAPNTMWDMLLSNLGELALFSAYYLVVGGLWSVVKWFLFSLKLRDKMKKKGDLKRPHESYASHNKGRLTGWVAMWPFSMLNTFIGDFLTKAFDHVVKLLSGVYEGISDRVWKGM